MFVIDVDQIRRMKSDAWLSILDLVPDPRYLLHGDWRHKLRHLVGEGRAYRA